MNQKDDNGLDATDHRILDLFRHNPGWTLANIAEATGKSESTIKARVRDLQESCLLVHGWVVQPESPYFSCRHLIYVKVNIGQIFTTFGDPRTTTEPDKVGVDGMIIMVMKQAKEDPYKDSMCIDKVYKTAGEYNVILEIFADRTDMVARFIAQEIAPIQGVRGTKTDLATIWMSKSS